MIKKYSKVMPKVMPKVYWPEEGSGSHSVAALVGAAPSLAWSAIVTGGNNQVLLQGTGVGTPTVTRSTAQYVLADTGYYNSFAANEPGYRGRRVQNFLRYSEDLSNAAWTKANATISSGVSDPNGGSTAFTLTASGANGQLYEGRAVTAESVSFSVWIRRRTGTGTVYIRAGTVDADISSSLTSSWKRITVNQASLTGTAYALIKIVTPGDAVDLWHPLHENTTHNVLDTTTPSEYVPNDTAKDGASDLFDANAYLTGTGSWAAYGNNIVATLAGENGVSVAYVDNTWGGNILFNNAADLNSDLVVGRKYILTASFKVNTGSVTPKINGPAVNGTAVTATSWEKQSIVFTATHATTNSLYFGVSMGAGEIVYVKDIVLKEATTGIKVFTTQNGNTVASNVVTEGTGAALSDWGLQVDPALTNLVTYSRDLPSGITATDWTTSGTYTATYDQIGLTGAANTATLYTDTDATVTQTFALNEFKSLSSETTNIVGRFFILKTSGETRRIGLSTDCMGGTVIRSRWTFNTNNGTLTAYTDAANDASATAEANDLGVWWEVLIYIESNTDNTAARVGMWPHVADSDTGAWTATLTGGAFVLGNVEGHYSKTIAEVRGTGPIFTTTAAVTTGSQTTSPSNSNINDTSGLLVFEFNVTGGATPLIGSFVSYDGINLKLDDSTTQDTAAAAANTWHKAAVWWDASNMQLVLNGTANAAVAYDGAMTALGLMNSATSSAALRNLKIYTGGTADQYAAQALTETA